MKMGGLGDIDVIYETRVFRGIQCHVKKQQKGLLLSLAGTIVAGSSNGMAGPWMRWTQLRKGDGSAQIAANLS